jgi:hypothetical protein
MRKPRLSCQGTESGVSPATQNTEINLYFIAIKWQVLSDTPLVGTVKPVK